MTLSWQKRCLSYKGQKGPLIALTRSQPLSSYRVSLYNSQR
jgi:hypothetical protein